MVKGVHQNIIEITETGSDCFERAILFVRPEKQEEDPNHLLGRAKLYLQDIKLRQGILGSKIPFFSVVKLISAAAAGAGIAAVLLR